MHDTIEDRCEACFGTGQKVEMKPKRSLGHRSGTERPATASSTLKYSLTHNGRDNPGHYFTACANIP